MPTSPPSVEAMPRPAARPEAVMDAAYPTEDAERTPWIVNRRGGRSSHDVWRAQGSFWECEPLCSGTLADTLTVLLTSRDCPWHCAMCDLWKFTVPDTIPEGAIARQIEVALKEAARREPPPNDGEGSDGPAQRQIKLYNGGSFFDPLAVPPVDYPRIARLVAGFERVIVECHPALVGSRAVQLQSLLWEAAAGRARGNRPVLEVAMGLETAHPEALARLNKRMTLEQFLAAARYLAEHEMALRAFVLVQPPFQPPAEAVDWARRSADYAFNCRANAVTLIPTRHGNGATEALTRSGEFTPPTLRTLEDAFDEVLTGAPARVFADLWNLEQFSRCPECFTARRDRLALMNLTQRVAKRISCQRCGGR